MSLIFIGLLERKEKKTFLEATREFDWPYVLCVATEDQNCGRRLIEVVFYSFGAGKEVVCDMSQKFLKYSFVISFCVLFSVATFSIL